MPRMALEQLLATPAPRSTSATVAIVEGPRIRALMTVTSVRISETDGHRYATLTGTGDMSYVVLVDDEPAWVLRPAS